ncbi:MAG: methylglutaconyl-CoA hydratase [Planctomycetota bacterium]|jgi:methylglutaconyl-CoA hydratase
MNSVVLSHVSDRIGYIKLNNPEKRNAMSPVLISGLKEAFLSMESNEDVKVVLLSASGKAFCAGADLAYLQQMQEFTYEQNLADSRRLKELFELIYNFPKVVIAAVQGHALAGGCGLVTVCDFAFSAPEALFGYTEVAIGFVPALVSVFLLEQIGGAKTQELLLSGGLITSSKAAELGLITEVIPTEELEKTAFNFAQKLIVKNSSSSMTETKMLLRELTKEARTKALDFAAELNAKVRANPDCKQGISAFLSKSKPVW